MFIELFISISRVTTVKIKKVLIKLIVRIQYTYIMAYNFRIICDKCGLSSQVRHKTVINASTYNFCSQNCLNSFQTGKRQKNKSKSKNGRYAKTVF